MNPPVEHPPIPEEAAAAKVNAPADKDNAALAAEPDLPPGDHPIEVAARRGFGPLSRLGKITWHGEASPCVSCGQLVLRGQSQCEHCGQDLREAMLERMREHAGPWYVFEHVRPFPGVSIQRIIRQIRRGLITPTSIVRGPATDHQWRFAGETPGLCLYFSRCWKCFAEVTLRDTLCANCGVNLLPAATGTTAPPQPPAAPIFPTAPPAEPEVDRALLPADSVAPPWASEESAPESTPEWEALRAALQSVSTARPVTSPQKEAALGIRPAWIAAAALSVVLLALLFLSQARNAALRNAPANPPPSASQMAPSDSPTAPP